MTLGVLQVKGLQSAEITGTVCWSTSILGSSETLTPLRTVTGKKKYCPYYGDSANAGVEYHTIGYVPDLSARYGYAARSLKRERKRTLLPPEGSGTLQWKHFADLDGRPNTVH